MKKIILTPILIMSFATNAQVGINTKTANATFEVAAESPTNPDEKSGVIVPRLSKKDLANKNTGVYTATQAGTLVFVTTIEPSSEITGPSASQVSDVVSPDYYYFDGTKWIRLLTDYTQDLRKIGGSSHITKDAGVGASGTSVGVRGTGYIGIGSNTLRSISVEDSTGAIAIGLNALRNYQGNTTTDQPVAIGKQSQLSNTNATLNVSVGTFSLNTATTADKNTAVGSSTLYDLRTGDNNTAVGYRAGSLVQLGNDNTFIGGNLLLRLKQELIHNENTFVGSHIMESTGTTYQARFTNNTFLGSNTGKAPGPDKDNPVYTLTEVSNVTLLGGRSGYHDNLFQNGNTTITNATAIGYNAKVGASNSLILGNNNVNVGIGNSVPKSKLHVTNGDVYIDSVSSGIILKSPSGNCFRITIDNSGIFISTPITCP